MIIISSFYFYFFPRCSLIRVLFRVGGSRKARSTMIVLDRRIRIFFDKFGKRVSLKNEKGKMPESSNWSLHLLFIALWISIQFPKERRKRKETSRHPIDSGSGIVRGKACLCEIAGIPCLWPPEITHLRCFFKPEGGRWLPRKDVCAASAGGACISKGAYYPVFLPSLSLSLFPRRWRRLRNGRWSQVYSKMERDVTQGSLGDRIKGWFECSFFLSPFREIG